MSPWNCLFCWGNGFSLLSLNVTWSDHVFGRSTQTDHRMYLWPCSSCYPSRFLTGVRLFFASTTAEQCYLLISEPSMRAKWLCIVGFLHRQLPAATSFPRWIKNDFSGAIPQAERRAATARGVVGVFSTTRNAGKTSLFRMVLHHVRANQKND